MSEILTESERDELLKELLAERFGTTHLESIQESDSQPR